ncbi:hypothetical protein [Nonomuraea recticatena]|uniref:Uncharacterized protein n=1 Tax=Nonomuraea recticatena TaxID=46178 RepID=A0ABP6FU48_9ACTN
MVDERASEFTKLSGDQTEVAEKFAASDEVSCAGDEDRLDGGKGAGGSACADEDGVLTAPGKPEQSEGFYSANGASRDAKEGERKGGDLKIAFGKFVPKPNEGLGKLSVGGFGELGRGNVGLDRAGRHLL